MSELRFHPFLNEWIITATHRQDRTFFPPDDFCPLCPTTNANLPTEIPESNFEIAVFENRFPSLQSPPTPTSIETTGFPRILPSEGVCEVVVYTPHHNDTFSDLTLSQVTRVCQVWKDRFLDLIQRPAIKYVYIFENKGKEIGVTLSHPHGQIYAYPFIPNVIQTRINAAIAFQNSENRTLAQAWLDFEIEDSSRVIEENEAFVCLVPYFARYPYEIHIVPKAPIQTLAQMDDKLLQQFAEMLLNSARRLDRLFGFSMPYILSLFQHDHPATRFSAEFTPPYRTKDKLKYLAGSEAGCGVFINDVLPEEAAHRLRNA